MIEKEQQNWDQCFYCIFALIFVIILSISGWGKSINASIFLPQILDSMGLVGISCVTLLWLLINGGLWSYCKMNGFETRTLGVYIILNIVLFIGELVVYFLGVSDKLEVLLNALPSIKLGIILLTSLLSVTGIVLGIQLRANLAFFKNFVGYAFMFVYAVPFFTFLVESLLIGTTRVFILFTTIVWIYSLSVLFVFFLKIEDLKIMNINN
ncbi:MULTISPECIES: hypothetical protein [Butyricimonas]|uniref:hypothetical protein n=1 Tax=Butyricimonas TaxID=574697 RepID=UPI0007FB3975|nr:MULTISPECIES: hypothetical protein [Butyricimonas]